MSPLDPVGAAFQFGPPEVRAVMLATAIIGVIAALRYRRAARRPDRPV